MNRARNTTTAKRHSWLRGLIAALLCAATALQVTSGAAASEGANSPHGTIHLAGRNAEDAAPYTWSVLDANTQKRAASVSRRWGTAEVPPGDYSIQIRQQYRSLEVNWQQVSVQAGKSVTVRIDSGIELSGRTKDEPAPYEWYVYDATTGKKVGYAYKRWGYMPLPPGKYRVAVRQMYDGMPIDWSEFTVEKGKLVSLKVDTGIVLAGRSDKDPAPYEWTVFDAATNKKVGYASKRWGFLPLSPGKYRVVIRQLYYSQPITWGEVTVEKAKVQKMSVRSGVTLKGPSDKNAPYKWEVFDTQTNKKVGYASKRWGFMPLPPGTYRLKLQVAYYARPIAWQTFSIAQDREVTVAVDSGVELSGRNANEKPPKRWTVYKADGRTEAGYASRRWGFIPLRPGEYVLQTKVGGATFLKSFTVEERRIHKLSLADIAPVLPPAPGKERSLPAAFGKTVPETPADLQAIQSHVRSLIPRIRAATVGIIVPGVCKGSGVVISADGYVLTAAHVSQVAGREVIIVFADGRRVRAKTLGADHTTDAGLIKISEGGDWPHVAVGDMNSVKDGSWCIAVGHPAGYKAGREPVIRLGRVISLRARTMFGYQIQTDAVIINGDSGGPLFDMHGRVIGINSCGSPRPVQNFHTPVSAFSETWVNLVRGAVTGRFGPERFATIGIYAEDHKDGCRIIDIIPGYPADLAGLKPGDLITKFDGCPVTSFLGLRSLKYRKRPGQTVELEVLRDGKTMTVTITFLEGRPK